MRQRTLRWALFGVLVCVGALTAAPAGARADPCQVTGEGRICQVQQPITAGTVVDTDLQRRLGLVTVNGGCSGTLLNRYWVLTARHCVTAGSTVAGPLLPAASVAITATWAPDRAGIPSRIHDFGINVGTTRSF